jgi:hypothetical protein
MIDFPADDEVLDFAERQRIGDADVILRDLARVATIFHLEAEGFLGEETVLAGGMALRCYGGHRFTVTDVDTSTKTDVSMARLDQLLNWEIENLLSVSTKGVGWYERGVGLEKAKPILFDPLFSKIELAESQAQFELTVNRRGLELAPVEQPFRHDFPWVLGVEGRPLPLMDPREMLAEKVLGYCIGGLGKHYADIAFIALCFRDRMPAEKAQLRRLTERKLEIGREAAKGAFATERYADFPDLSALREPLENPERHLGVGEFGREVRFVIRSDGRGVIPLSKAKVAVCRFVVPWLFG